MDKCNQMYYIVIAMLTLGKLSQRVVSRAAGAVISWVQKCDPRIVRLRELSRVESPLLSRPLMCTLFLGGLLVIGAVAVGATRAEDNPEPSDGLEKTRPNLKAQSLPKEKEPEPPALPTDGRDKTGLDKAREPAEGKLKSETRLLRHPKFFDPIYVFSNETISEVRAYPLADPPGVVVDLMNVALPSEKPENFVARDERVQSIRRRVMPFGLRYIVILTIPLNRIELFHEGNVAMIFPQS